MKIALVLPHMFMHNDILNNVIFSPGHLGISLAKGLKNLGHEVTFFSPGYTVEGVENINADLTNFEEELRLREDSYVDLLKKHPLIFISLARQAQSEIISHAYSMANKEHFDIVHVYTNEEELALAFANLCRIPVVFTHHEPFNYLAKYRNSFPKYKDLNWISISYSQRKSMPKDTNFVGNVYHGLDKDRFELNLKPQGNYLAYYGRIVEPKGVHLAIAAAKKSGIKLKIAGKHYSGFGKDKYWAEVIEPQIDGKQVEYVGFLDNDKERQEFLGNAKALLVPSTWEEPFGMVMIEALACGTPIIGLESGAIPEVIENGKTGLTISNLQLSINNEIPNFKFQISSEKAGVWKTPPLKGGRGDVGSEDEVGEATRNSTLDTRNSKLLTPNLDELIDNLCVAINQIDKINRRTCREEFEKRFTLERMCGGYEEIYKSYL